MKKNLQYFVRFAALLFLGVLTLSSCVNEDPESIDASRLKTGDMVPAFTVTLSDGAVFTSPTDLMGHDTRLLLFTTTCPDCQRALSKLQAEGNTANLICISRAESAADVAAYWEQEGLSLRYAAVDDRSVYNLFAKAGVPRLYAVGPDGRVTSQLGPSDF